MALFLYFGLFNSKSVIMLVLCLDLARNHFHQILLNVFKINDTVDFEITFLHISSGYQTRILHSKYVLLIVLCLVFTNRFFQQFLLSGSRVNYSVNIENYLS